MLSAQCLDVWAPQHANVVTSSPKTTLPRPTTPQIAHNPPHFIYRDGVATVITQHIDFLNPFSSLAPKDLPTCVFFLFSCLQNSTRNRRQSAQLA